MYVDKIELTQKMLVLIDKMKRSDDALIHGNVVLEELFDRDDIALSTMFEIKDLLRNDDKYRHVKHDEETSEKILLEYENRLISKKINAQKREELRYIIDYCYNVTEE